MKSTRALYSSTVWRTRYLMGLVSGLEENGGFRGRRAVKRKIPARAFWVISGPSLVTVTDGRPQLHDTA